MRLCTGTIGAIGNNMQGVAGVNWNAHIIGCKFLDGADGVGSMADAAECIRWCRDQGARITSNSWGGQLAIDLSLVPGLLEEMRSAEVGMCFGMCVRACMCAIHTDCWLTAEPSMCHLPFATFNSRLAKVLLAHEINRKSFRKTNVVQHGDALLDAGRWDALCGGIGQRWGWCVCLVTDLQMRSY
jgi:hypothetical protein